jgi:branched-chain amino acid transport system permease protein
MEYFLQAIVNGLLMGSVYGLTALGLTLIFGVMKVINFAHGSFLMIGMFASYWLFALTGLDPYVGLIVVVPFCFAVGYFTQAVLIQPIFKMEKGVREPLGVLLLTSGLWLFLDNVALLLFGADFRAAKTAYSGMNYQFGSILVSVPRFYAFAGTMAGAIALYVFLKITSIGKAIRATGQDRDVAGLMGVNIYRIYNIAFGIGIAITGLVGGLLTPFFYVHPTVGFAFDIRAFVIVVLGGLGSIPGALIGGLIIGLIESVGAQFMTATGTAAIIYIIFLLVLFFKPEGLLGLKEEW